MLVVSGKLKKLLLQPIEVDEKAGKEVDRYYELSDTEGEECDGEGARVSRPGFVC